MAKVPEKKFAPRRKMCIIVDEYGDYGEVPKKQPNGKYRPTKTVGFGVSVIRNKSAYLDIYDDIRRVSGAKGEMKGAKVKDPMRRREISKKIQNSGALTYGYNIDKDRSDIPKYWHSVKSNNERVVRTLGSTMEHVLDKRRMNEATVIIDRHDAYKDCSKKLNATVIPKNWDLAKKVVKDVADKKNMKIKVSIVSSGANNDYAHLIQVNDFVTNSVYRHTELGDKTDTKLMNTRVRRLKR